MRLNRVKRCLQFWSVLATMFVFVNTINGQIEPVRSQYTLNPIVINPAFTGFHNTLVFDLSVRKQWIGVNGSPSSVFLSAHSPINDSKISLGAYIQRWQAGPLSFNNVTANYSFLARINDNMYVSLGADLGLIYQQLSLSDMILVDQNDPNFAQSQYSEIIPVVGVGAVLFTPYYYFGISRPMFSVAQISLGKGSANTKLAGTNYAVAGLSLPKFASIVTKLSFFMRYADTGEWLLDNTLQFYFKSVVGIGFTYRPQNSMAVMMHIQATRNAGFTYSYDISMANAGYQNKGSHEITLTYDNFTFYKKNKYRGFKRSKKDVDDKLRSIRDF